MKKISTLMKFCSVFVLGMIFFSSTANAYIDPSAMTYIVQIIVGIVVAGGAAFAFTFRKLKRKITRKKDDVSEQDNYDNNTSDSDVYDDDEFDLDDDEAESDINAEDSDKNS